MPIDITTEFAISAKEVDHFSGSAAIDVPFRDAHAKVSLDLSGRRCIVQLFGLRVEAEVMSALAKTGMFVDRCHYPLVLNQLDAEIRQVAEKVLHAWKYLLARDERIPEGALAAISRKWKESSDSEWTKFPSWIEGTFSARQIPVLTGVAIDLLQQLINDGITPLVGMRYLHRAKGEADPKYRWVDATIAAELSIKEILQMARPETKILFKSLPSPPLAKLYGDVLAEYCGERSPHLNALRAGSETRNALIHQPTVTHVDTAKAAEYVGIVEAAIFHALALCFKDKRYFDFWKAFEPR